MWMADAPAQARARLTDGLNQQGRLLYAQPGAAVLRRHADAQPACLGDGGMKVEREAAMAVFLQPVVCVELFAGTQHRLAD